METKLFVGNLPYSVGDDDLEAAFADHGSVVSVVVIRDRETGRSRGFGFVEMETEEMAQAAAGALDGIEMVAGCESTRRNPKTITKGAPIMASAGKRRFQR